MLTKVKRLIELPFWSIVWFMLNVSLEFEFCHMLDKMEDIGSLVTCGALVRTLNNFTP
jgi:hypothetical protein